MKLCGVDKCKFVEVFKKHIKKYDQQFNIIEFEMNDLMDMEMEKYKKHVLEIAALYNKHEL